MPNLYTPRLILRQWTSSDVHGLATLNANPAVMKYFPRPLSAEESSRLLTRLQAAIDERGWGIWAAELSAEKKFIGFVGLQPTPRELPFPITTEIAWRLAPEYWGLGYASEAAQVALNFGFEKLCVDEIVAIAPVVNRRSTSLMERLGMLRGATFIHPFLERFPHLRTCVVYSTSTEHRSSCAQSII